MSLPVIYSLRIGNQEHFPHLTLVSSLRSQLDRTFIQHAHHERLYQVTDAQSVLRPHARQDALRHRQLATSRRISEVREVLHLLPDELRQGLLPLLLVNLLTPDCASDNMDDGPYRQDHQSRQEQKGKDINQVVLPHRRISVATHQRSPLVDAILLILQRIVTFKERTFLNRLEPGRLALHGRLEHTFLELCQHDDALARIHRQ